VVDARDRTILRLAVPALAALATTPLYVLVDTAIVGHLGTVPLGGLALATSALTALFFVTTFLEYGITARVAQHVGRGDRRAAATIFVQGLWVAGGLGLVLAGGLLAGARPLAGLLGGHGRVLAAAVTYLRISVVWVPFELACLVGTGWLRGVQDTRTPLWVALGGNGVNLVLEVVLVYGFHLGIAGSAWGTVVATVVAAGWYVAAVAPRLGAGTGWRPVAAELRRLLATGGHLAIRTGALLGTLTVATAVAARLGTTTLAGHQIALQIETFLALVVDSLAIAGQALVGTALGAGDVDQARAVGRRLVELGLLAGAGLCLLVVATSAAVPLAFTADGAVRHRATVALVVVGVLQLPAAVVFVLDGVLLGASDDAFQGWSNAAALAVYLPFAAAVPHWRRLGIAGVWAGLLAWMLARLAGNATRFAGHRWTDLAAKSYR
jgi:putative MATE family efflux protein